MLSRFQFACILILSSVSAPLSAETIYDVDHSYDAGGGVTLRVYGQVSYDSTLDTLTSMSLYVDHPSGPTALTVLYEIGKNVYWIYEQDGDALYYSSVTPPPPDFSRYPLGIETAVGDPIWELDLSTTSAGVTQTTAFLTAGPFSGGVVIDSAARILIGTRAVPEPASYVLATIMGLAVGAVKVVRSRRSKHNSLASAA